MRENRSIYLNDDQHFEMCSSNGINFRQRIILLTDELENSFSPVDLALTEMENRSSADITVKIKCPGGCVYDGMAIVGRIKSSSCRIITEGYGQVMSAATLILASGDHRRMSEYGSFMWHHGTVSPEQMDSTKVLDYAQEVKELNDSWCEYMAKFSKSRKADAAFWNEAGNKDTYFSAKELKKLGVIDEII